METLSVDTRGIINLKKKLIGKERKFSKKLHKNDSKIQK